MDSNTIIMLLALGVNFVAMLAGLAKILSVVVQYHVQQERRMATIEEQIKQLMRVNNMKVRAVA